MWRKACPKCQGMVYRERHLADDYDLVCLQCGRILTKPEERALLERLKAQSAAGAGVKAGLAAHGDGDRLVA